MRTRYLQFIVCGLLVIGCASANDSGKGVADSRRSNDPGPVRPPVSGSPNDPTQTPVAGRHPKILVHGSGPSITPRSAVDMEPLARMLVQAGFPPENIHKADYPLGSNLATTVGVLSQAIRSIMDRYPSTTKFDIIGHSMGHAAGLHAIMAGQTGQRVRKFIGIAGVAFGQAAKPMPCFLLPCGDMFDFLIPFKSQNVMQFMMTHQAAIDQLDKCSIFSPQDGSLNPFDAGAFPDGRNISLPQVGHLRAISSPAVMNALITECYGGTLD